MINRLLILGSYGQNNIGDEAILYCLLSYFNKYAKTIYVNSSNPVETQRKYNVKVINTNLRHGFLKNIIIILRSNVIIFGGGTLLVEHRDLMGKLNRRAIYLCFLLLLLAFILQKKRVLFSISIDKIETRWGKTLTYFCLKLSNLTVLRESASVIRAQSLGVKNVVLGTDLVFAIKKPKLKNKLPNNKIKIGMALTYWLKGCPKTRDNFLQKLIKVVQELSRKQKYEIILLPFRSGYGENDDYWFCNKIIAATSNRANIKIIKTDNFNDAMQKISSLDLLIAMRLHAVIFSFISCIPVIAINYQNKVKDICDDLNYNNILDPKELTPERIVNDTKRMLRDKIKIKIHMQKEAAIKRKIANDTLDLVRRYVD